MAEVVLVYFKTGYHFDIDNAATSHGYTVIGPKEWVAFLNGHPIRHDIFRDYLEYMSRLLQEREEAIEALAGPKGHERLTRNYVQFELIQQLTARCPETIGGSAIHRGTNMGGTPWTHYRFALFERALPGGIGEALFHRVDARNDEEHVRRFYLSTRQYASVKGIAEARTEKLRRLRVYRASL